MKKLLCRFGILIGMFGIPIGVGCASSVQSKLVQVKVGQPPTEQTDCQETLTCYDGTEDGLLAGCSLGSPVCVRVPQSDGGYGEEIVECRGEQLFLDGGCSASVDCFAATNGQGFEVTVCDLSDGG